MNDALKQKGGLWLTLFFAACASFLAGVGTVHVTLAAQVSRHTTKIEAMDRTLEDNRAEHKEMRDDFTKRLTTLVSEQANYVSISRDFIVTLKADRDMLLQNIRQNEKLIELLGNGGKP